MSSTQISKCFVLSALVALVSLSLTNNLSSDIGLWIVASLIAFFGLPHGALDIFLFKSLLKHANALKFTGIVAAYVAVAAFSVVAWYALPMLSLVLFLGISVFHFSEDWRHIYSRCGRVALACMLICGPTIMYSDEVAGIFMALLLSSDQADAVTQMMLAVYVIATMALVLNLTRGKFLGLSIWTKLELATLCLSAIVLPPLLHFTIYFCSLHSLKHLNDFAIAKQVPLGRVILLSLPITLLTLLTAYLAYELFLVSSVSSNSALLQIIFIGLFGLTVSHMLVIHKWHHQFDMKLRRAHSLPSDTPAQTKR